MSKFYEKVTYRDVEEDLKSQKSVDKWIFRLLLIVIGFMPLIVMASVTEVQSPLISNIDNLSSGVKGDLFTQYKALVLLVITFLASLLFLAKILFMSGDIRKTKLNYAVGAFAVAIVLSTIFSPNISISLHGQYSRADGAISWICYLALFFIAMNIEYPKKVVNHILYSLYPFIIINFIIITVNFYGKDLLQYTWVQKFVSAFLPDGATISEGSELIGTLNQWNYMSGMFGIMTLLFLASAIVANSNVKKFTNLFIALLSMIIMLMAMSASGFFTFVCITPLLIWLAIKSLNRKRTLLIMMIFFITTACFVHSLSLKNPKVWDESIGFFLPKNNPYGIEQSVETSIVGINLDSLSVWNIEKASAAKNTFELPVLPEAKWGPGTGRIYIWEKTLDLVKDRPFLGYGLDTLVYQFPHNHIDARGNLNEVTIVDKPHNIYVGVIYGTGILGILAFLAIILISLKSTIREIFKFNMSSNLVVALCIAWLAFLIQALFNDTSIGITGPLFAIGGIMLGLLYKRNEITV
ncbi:O-antigen ligase family protein [Lysinibacillus sp. CNPSo 3705]|uniref:O-antigen ligase family protein n=1 Tax=Lysinibacillus sp. CNPSo 3705 TaxID=3028148 RepID=UPI0023644682|nr:O-antigen ligase family protein [Lysinibacillus sp. CNPSo 3705]MDD1505884.1 O-antigen ligase family protein [Lysinibacillus sp. CNPSo 3705]